MSHFQTEIGIFNFWTETVWTVFKWIDSIDFILINLTIDIILVSTVIIYCFQILIKFELPKLKLM